VTVSKKKRIGWKIAVDVRYKRTVWVKLEILGTVVQPMHPYGKFYNKMRTDKVKVLAVYNGKGKKLKRTSPTPYVCAKVISEDGHLFGQGMDYPTLTYKPGEILETLLDPDIRNECGEGIHFCDTKADVLQLCLRHGWRTP
jgi:hypothetical protein